jgi:hypothetical protein
MALYMRKLSPFFIGIFIVFVNASYALDSLDSILVGGVYRMDLMTGDVIEGVVEQKSDTGLIIESQGTPYAFNAALIVSFTLLEVPKKRDAVSPKNGVDTLSYESLLRGSAPVSKVQVTITNGTSFIGVISSIDSQRIKINIDGSIIDVEKSVVARIVTIPLPKPSSALALANIKKPVGPLDTVYVLEKGKTDWGGDTLIEIMIIGAIQNSDITGVTIETPNGIVREFKQDRIARITRHTATSYDDKIKAYVKSLFCGENQILIDMPPGSEDKPFFKVCMDKYEFPNKRDVMPQTMTSYNDAQKTCKSQGKRLCYVEEWQWGCSGKEGYVYPYGPVMVKDVCNRDGATRVEVSGTRVKCAGKFGVFDMTGNVFEWVMDENAKPKLMGGPVSKCQNVSPGENTIGKPNVGFRCCKSNY